MGPPESLAQPPKNQASGRRKRPTRPRLRRCLLKGCELRFHPRQTRQRYCSARCREEARKWSQWKAQQRYRATKAGQEKRSYQSRRYRERVKSRKPAEPEPDNEAARVITPETFFRSFLRPARLLRGIHTSAAKSLTALLFARLPAGDGARARTGAPLETGADLKPEILIRRRSRPYIQPVRCNWSFINSTPAGSICACTIRGGNGGCWPRWQRLVSRRPSS